MESSWLSCTLLGSVHVSRVNMSSVIPQWLGEVDGPKGMNNPPFSALGACSGRTIHRDS